MVSSLLSLTSFEAFSAPFLRFQNNRINTLNQQKTNLKQRLSVFSSLKTRFQRFDSVLDDFVGSDVFSLNNGRLVKLSQKGFFTAEVTAESQPGVSSVSVQRIASQDTFASREVLKTGTNLSDLFKGANKFTFQVGDGSEITIKVKISKDESNQAVLANIANAITAAGGGLVSAEVINTSATTSRLTIRSTDTGASQFLTFTSAKRDLLFGAGLDFVNTDFSRKQRSSTGGGAAVTNADALNALLTINGIQIVRESNTIDDVLTGITLQLTAAQADNAAAISLSIEAPAKEARKKITDFITEFNKTVNYLDTQTRPNPATFARGPLATDYAFRNLRLKFRSIVSRNINSSDGNPQQLFELGISLQRNGTLAITDSEKLDSFLQKDLNKVGAILTAENSIGARLADTIKNFAGSRGIIDRRERMESSRIATVDRRLKRIDRDITSQQNSLRRRFAQIQKTLSALTTQQSFLSGLFSPNRFGIFNSFLRF